MTTLTLGEQLDALMKRMDAATDAWRDAGHPYDGPVYEAREAVYAALRAWTEQAKTR